MLYGSGEYDVHRDYVPSPVPRVRPEASNIADKHRGDGMYTCLNQPRIATFGRQSQNVNMDDGPMRYAGVKSPILVDPVYNGGKYSNRSARPVPRVRPEAAEVAEKSKGCMGVLFSNYGKRDPYDYGNSRDENINPRNGPLRKAGVRSPILVDPVYKDGEYSGRTPRPAPRVRPEAEEIATKSMGSVSKLFVTQERRYDEYTKPKKEVKNHTAENVKRMRQIQRESRARERQRNTPVKALWKSQHYDGVESKVKDLMQDPPKAPRTEAQHHQERPHSAPPRTTRDDNHNANDGLKPKRSVTPRPSSGKIDFVSRNARLAKSYELGRSRSQLATFESNSKYREGLNNYNLTVKGKTPAYLQARQKLWDKNERERIRNIPDPTVPEGHTVMPDKERRETLSTLKQTYSKSTSITTFEEINRPLNRWYSSYNQPMTASYYPHYSEDFHVNETVDRAKFGKLSEAYNYTRENAIFPYEYRYNNADDHNTDFQHIPHPPSYKRNEVTPYEPDSAYFAQPNNHYDDDHYNDAFSHADERNKPNINITAQNGSPVYVYAPGKVTNIHPSNTDRMQEYANAYDDDDVVYGTTARYKPPKFTVTNDEDAAQYTHSPAYRYEIKLDNPDTTLQQNQKSVTFKDETMNGRQSLLNTNAQNYRNDTSPPTRAKTTYRDSFEPTYPNEEHNMNYWRDTDYYQSAQPTLWEYETGRRNWSDGLLR